MTRARPNRDCLRPPIPEIAEAARLIDEAFARHEAGDFARAEELFAVTNSETIRAWTTSIWSARSDEIHQLRPVDGLPPLLARADRLPVRMPTGALRAQLIARDGYRCRYCGNPLIPESVRKRAHRLYPVAVPRGRTNLTQHAAFQAMWLQFDHVVPHSRGGTNEPTTSSSAAPPAITARWISCWRNWG